MSSAIIRNSTETGKRGSRGNITSQDGADVVRRGPGRPRKDGTSASAPNTSSATPTNLKRRPGRSPTRFSSRVRDKRNIAAHATSVSSHVQIQRRSTPDASSMDPEKARTERRRLLDETFKLPEKPIVLITSLPSEFKAPRQLISAESNLKTVKEEKYECSNLEHFEAMGSSPLFRQNCQSMAQTLETSTATNECKDIQLDDDGVVEAPRIGTRENVTLENNSSQRGSVIQEAGEQSMNESSLGRNPYLGPKEVGDCDISESIGVFGSKSGVRRQSLPGDTFLTDEEIDEPLYDEKELETIGMLEQCYGGASGPMSDNERTRCRQLLVDTLTSAKKIAIETGRDLPWVWANSGFTTFVPASGRRLLDDTVTTSEKLDNSNKRSLTSNQEAIIACKRRRTEGTDSRRNFSAGALTMPNLLAVKLNIENRPAYTGEISSEWVGKLEEQDWLPYSC